MQSFARTQGQNDDHYAYQDDRDQYPGDYVRQFVPRRLTQG